MSGTSLALTPPDSVITQLGPSSSFIGSFEVNNATLFVVRSFIGVIILGSALNDPPSVAPDDKHITTSINIVGQISGNPGGAGDYTLGIAGYVESAFDIPLVTIPPPVLSSGWDVYADTSGNIATVTSLAAQLQDVACACRLFLGELWYDTTQGLPYLGQILGRASVATPPLSFISAQIIKAGLTVPGVTRIVPVLSLLSPPSRELTGTVGVVNQQGQTGTLQVGGGNNLPWYVSSVSPQTPN